jgi:hypothetical protein
VTGMRHPLKAPTDSTLIPSALAQPETKPASMALDVSKTAGQRVYRATPCHGPAPLPSGSQARNGGSIPLTLA